MARRPAVAVYEQRRERAVGSGKGKILRREEPGVGGGGVFAREDDLLGQGEVGSGDVGGRRDGEGAAVGRVRGREFAEGLRGSARAGDEGKVRV